MGLRKVVVVACGVLALGCAASPAFADAAPSLPDVAKHLAETRKSATSGQVAAALKGIKPDGGADLATALEEKRPDRDTPGYKAALATAQDLRALAAIGTTPAVREIVRVSGDAGGAYRPEVARILKALGDRAVPALVEARKEPSFEVRRWAAAQLESMGKRLPGDAVQTKDNDVLADVLRAYGAVRDLDAMPVILAFVASDRVVVRSAARDATLAFGQDAVWKLREAYANVVGKPAPDGMSAADTAKELFAAYDRLRLQEVYGLLDEGLAKEKDGRLEEAIADFDRVLARQPMLDRRAEMVPGYIDRARALEDGDPTQARTTFERALRLAPDGPRAKSIEAELAYLDGVDLASRGIVDRAPFRRALELDPAHAKARAKLDALEVATEERSTKLRAVLGGGAVLLLGIVATILFAGPRRRRALRA
jgi:tetratricopeptide (TPR) repeat protein